MKPTESTASMVFVQIATPRAVVPFGGSHDFVFSAKPGFAYNGGPYVEIADEKLREAMAAGRKQDVLAGLCVEFATRIPGADREIVLSPGGEPGQLVGGRLRAPLWWFVPSLGGGFDIGLPCPWPDGTFSLRVINRQYASGDTTPKTGVGVETHWRLSGYQPADGVV